MPLMTSAANACPDVIDCLLNHGADIELKDAADYTALHIACFKNQVYNVSELLKHKAQVNTTENWKQTPLMTAAVTASPEVIDCLLNHGADIEQNYYNGETALHTVS